MASASPAAHRRRSGFGASETFDGIGERIEIGRIFLR
jgi:hypothetical protein